MATSAANLQLILDIAVKHSDMEQLKKALIAKDLLPKKLQKETVKPEQSPFASKAAAEFAAKHSVAIKGLKGTSKRGEKLTVADLKAALEPASKISVSPAAAKYARDNGVDLASIRKDGKILLADVKVVASEDSEPEVAPKIKLSTAAAREVKKYNFDDEDLETIKGSGKGGSILLTDLKELIAEMDSETDSESDSE
jgi:pyruvate/2-oxoglutarate dehydrogenase complex dihydrolipoamide acyltransferase (E2) component